MTLSTREPQRHQYNRTSISSASTTRNNKKKERYSLRSRQKHTTVGIRMWSPTILLTYRRVA
ncbi:hypothetical protein BDV19DRAFT_32990 [Aspergillus venezuelensis]